MPDILLIQPPISDFYLTAKRTIPYGLASIASSLIKENFSVTIFDALSTSKSKIIDLPKEMNYLKKFYGKEDVSPFSLFHHFKHFGYSYEHLKKIIEESAPFLIGISSLFTPYCDEAIKCANIAKEVFPFSKIVLGGHHPTALPEKVMENKSVDYIIRGEGEVSMALIAKNIKTGKNISDIPGIVFRKKNGTLHISDPAIMAKIDDYPFPASHLIKKSYYKRGKKGSISIMTSRGCPMKCSYCSMGQKFLKYRRRSVEKVISEIELEVVQNNAGFIDFEDENLSLDRTWFIGFLEKIISKFGKYNLELRAMNGLFPPSLDIEMIKLMKKAGFKTLNLSLGSTSRDQLNKFCRPDVRKPLENVLKQAESIFLEAVSYIIVGAPGQNATESVKDLLYLAKQKTLIGVSVFYPAPGSQDYLKAQELDILPKNFSLMRSTALTINNTTTQIESVTLLRLGRILNFIKLLKERNETIPSPLPFSAQDNIDTSDRIETGKKILQWFFHDGKIRGATPYGEIYEHNISTDLSRYFIKEYNSQAFKNR